MKKRLVTMLATGFGLGYSPVASGTTGSLPGVALAWLLSRLPAGLSGTAAEAAVCALLCVVAIPICGAAEAMFGKKDDGRIVADEYLTFPICMIGLPFIPWVVAMAFVTCRVMDIVKPPPARGLQAVHGGFGIVIDDVFASLYSLAANHLLFWLVTAHLLPRLALA